MLGVAPGRIGHVGAGAGGRRFSWPRWFGGAGGAAFVPAVAGYALTGLSGAQAAEVDQTVGRLVDVAGNDHVATAPSAAACGILRSVGGRIAIELDGVDDHYRFTLMTARTQYFAFAVARTSGGGVAHLYSPDSVPAAANALAPVRHTGTEVTTLVLGSALAPAWAPLAIGETAILEVIADTDANPRVRGSRNGGADVPIYTTSGNFVVEAVTRMIGRNASGLPWAGLVFAAVERHTLPTPAERAALRTHLAALSGVSL